MMGQRAEHSGVVAESGKTDARFGDRRKGAETGQSVFQSGAEYVGACGKSSADDDKLRIDDEENCRKACGQCAHLPPNAG